MTEVGYARVSTRDQNPGSQVEELRAADCDRVFVDHGWSSRIEDRPEWIKCVDYLRSGDTLVITALDRIAGSEMMAIELIRDLGRRGIRLRSLSEPFLDVDTSTPMGEAIVGIMAWSLLASCITRPRLPGWVRRRWSPTRSTSWPSREGRPPMRVVRLPSRSRWVRSRVSGTR